MSYDNYLKKYESKTGKSRKMYSKAAGIFPGGISHNIRFFDPYPFFVNSARGKYLHDIDGNTYTDYWMGHWAMILGHSPSAVSSVLAKQVKNGTLYGVANDASVELGAAIQKFFPRAEMMRFSSTGSEATMYAVRLARAKTGRRVIAKAIGGWHGFNTTLMQTVNYPFEAEEGPGLVQDEGQYVESIQFNNLESSLKVLETVKDDLACIIIEPVLGGAGGIPPEKGYLQGLQEFAKRNDIIFILDEIVTGFRISPNGAASEYGLEPDLFTLGKIVGGGLPIGVVCGNKEIMSLADPISKPDKVARCAIGGGTFSANPVTMAAGLATLDYIKKNKASLYPKINRLGDMARKGLSRIFSEAGIPCHVTGTHSLFLTHFVENNQAVVNALDVATSNKKKLMQYHMALMAEHGIFFLPTKMGAISNAHEESDIKKLLSATQKIVDLGLLKQT